MSFKLKILGELELNPGDEVKVYRNLEPKFEYTAPANIKAKVKIMVVEKYG
jgi:hypothetical protein